MDYMTSTRSKGFTIIELLVTIAIVGLLLGITAFVFEGTRKNARDDRRKTDMASIVAGMENFYSDCGLYLSDHSYACRAGTTNVSCWPEGASPVTGLSWIFENPSYGKQACLPSNIYIRAIPNDPQYPSRRYAYKGTSVHQSGVLTNMPSSYVICAALENPPSPAMDTSQCTSTYSSCGDYPCNYVIKSPR